MEVLSKNYHTITCKNQIEGGWKYSQISSTTNNIVYSNTLVPYDYLTPAEKSISQNTMMHFVKCLLYFNVQLDRDPDYSTEDLYLSNKSKVDSELLQKFKSKAYNLFLLMSSKHGNLEIVDELFKIIDNKNINSMDEYRHTPIYHAVKRGHYQMVDKLLKLGSRIDIKDINGIDPFMLSCILGNFEICKLLLENNCSVLERDNRYLTAL